jgi:16S rRNA (cytosine1402-N4)-methyltransferase
MRDDPRHQPVLATTVLDVLRPMPGESVLDVTLGLGGHALRFLEATAPDGRLVGLDADAANLEAACERLSDHADRVTLIHGNFLRIAEMELPQVDVILADLGLSSPHLDDPERGFAFRFDAPLDMRFDREHGRTAAEVIADSDERRLADILYEYGEIHESRYIAKKLAGRRLATTTELRAMIEEMFGWRTPQFLPRVFQALRIAVNAEMQALAELLQRGPHLLTSGGRMGIISYHSLEDRQVKLAFKLLTTPEKDPVTGKAMERPPYELLTKKAVVPSPDEEASNPRSRSAKFRAISRR